MAGFWPSRIFWRMIFDSVRMRRATGLKEAAFLGSGAALVRGGPSAGAAALRVGAFLPAFFFAVGLAAALKPSSA